MQAVRKLYLNSSLVLHSLLIRCFPSTEIAPLQLPHINTTKEKLKPARIKLTLRKYHSIHLDWDRRDCGEGWWGGGRGEERFDTATVAHFHRVLSPYRQVYRLDCTCVLYPTKDFVDIGICRRTDMYVRVSELYRHFFVFSSILLKLGEPLKFRVN